MRVLGWFVMLLLVRLGGARSETESWSKTNASMRVLRWFVMLFGFRLGGAPSETEKLV